MTRPARASPGRGDARKRHHRRAGRSRPGCRARGLGEMPYMAMPVRTRSKWALGDGQRGRRVGDVPHLGAQPCPLGLRHASAETASSWASMEGWPGSSAQAKCDHSAGDADQARRPRRARASATSSGQSAGWQPLRPSPVSALSWTRAVRPRPRAAASTSRSAHIAADRHVDVGLDGLPPGPAGRPEPAHAAVRRPIPAARSASASSGVAVPSQVGARLDGPRGRTGPAPWP